jgi:uncharacterized OsmC-like protein
MAETVVQYEGSLRCRAEHAGSGVVVVTDAPADHHGLGESHSPSDLLAVSLGSCILSVMGIAARAMEVELTGASATVVKRMANAPRRITEIGVTVRVPGVFSDMQKVQLETAAHGCPVHQVLGIEAPIGFVWD